jgi:hypothetical protein
MNIDVSTVRLLGAAQLMVFIGGIVSERLLLSTVGSGSISDILVSISANLARIRISNLIALFESVFIIILGVLFYVVFNEQYRAVSLLALGLFLAEGITLAVSKIGAYGLVTLSQEFAEAGSSDSPLFRLLGDFLYSGVDRRGYDIHLLFFGLGGILWYYLLYVSGSIPQAISMWGLVAVILLTITVLLKLYDSEFLPAVQILALPYAPFELVLGIWLIVRGFN